MKYAVTFTFGGCVIVEAENKEAAEEQVEEMPTDALFNYARDGFEIQEVTPLFAGDQV
jgi:hypothetical protein